MNCEICRQNVRNLKKHEHGKMHRSNILCKLMSDYLNINDNSLMIEYVNNFYCIQCSVTLHTYNAFTWHLKTEEHRTKNTNEDLQNPHASNPLFYYCRLCYIECLDSPSCMQHLKGHIHQRIERLFNLLFGRIASNEPVVSKPYVCNLCLIPLGSPKNYEGHVNGKKHKSYEHIVNSFLMGNKQYDYLDEKRCLHFNDLRPNEFFCKLCNVHCSKSKVYDHFLNGKYHKMKEEYICRKYRSINGYVDLCYIDERVNSIFKLKRSPFYCKICYIWCQDYDFLQATYE